MRSRLVALSLVLAGASACDAGSSMPSDAATATADARAPRPFVPEHTFPAIELPVGGEIQNVCQSWTLDNDEPLFVNAVEMQADPGWHHSNWMFVPDVRFRGDDGTWDCDEREFNEVSAALSGGAVFFAQSTQATHETQQFPAGAAFRIPPRSRVIGSIHVLNFTGAPLSSALTFRLRTLPESEVEVELRGLAIDNRVMEIPPRGRSEITTACDLTRANGGPLDFGVYHVLPHYHGLATAMRVEVVGGPRDGATLFETSAAVGDPLGQTLDPPFVLEGATGMRTTCTYANTGDTTVRWGVDAADEMCTMLAWVSGRRTLGALASTRQARETLPDGTLRVEAECDQVLAR